LGIELLSLCIDARLSGYVTRALQEKLKTLLTFNCTKDVRARASAENFQGGTNGKNTENLQKIPKNSTI